MVERAWRSRRGAHPEPHEHAMKYGGIYRIGFKLLVNERPSSRRC